MNTNANEAAVATRETFFNEVNPLNQTQVAAAATGKVLKFDMSANYWTPLQIGERKRLIFQETNIEPAPDFNDPAKMVDLRVAKFVEVYVDEKTGEIRQQMVRTAATKILSFIDSFNLPKHACLEIEYKGKMKSKKAARMYDDFAFYPVMQDIDQPFEN